MSSERSTATLRSVSDFRRHPSLAAPRRPAEAIADVRIRVPTRGNRKLERLIDAVNADEQVKAWWHVAAVNATRRLGMSDHSWIHIQIVLNIPPHPTGPAPSHLDGHRPHQSKPDTFSLLAAVFLGDESEPGRGNVWVWPGSHRRHERLFRDHGPEVLLPVSGSAARLDPPFALGEPVPVLARRGDVLLSHFLRGHASGPNTTTTVRRIVNHRLVCEGHDERWAATLTDAFTEFAPVRRALARV